MATLSIAPRTLDRILAAARVADDQECMGLLAGPSGSPIVTAMLRLPATASSAHAMAEPTAILQSAEVLRARHLVPKGLWHSHGRFGVFHSGTDHATLNRLLPAMAPWNFERPRAAILAPTVTAPDAALLPTLDGQVWHFSLLGAAIPDLDAHEQAVWDSIVTHFTKTEGEPRAVFAVTHLHLEGGGVALTLEIPEGASVVCQKQDRASFRHASLYSLVVNSRSEQCAECLIVYEIDDQYLTQQEPCEVATIEDDDGTTI